MPSIASYLSNSVDIYSNSFLTQATERVLLLRSREKVAECPGLVRHMLQ